VTSSSDSYPVRIWSQRIDDLIYLCSNWCGSTADRVQLRRSPVTWSLVLDFGSNFPVTFDTNPKKFRHRQRHLLQIRFQKQFWTLNNLYLGLGLELDLKTKRWKEIYIALSLLLSLRCRLEGAGARDKDKDQDGAEDGDGYETDSNCEVFMSRSYLALPCHTWPDLTWSSLTTPNRTDKSGLVVLPYPPLYAKKSAWKRDNVYLWRIRRWSQLAFSSYFVVRIE